MKPGHGKLKGSQFERELCTKLSLWVSAGARRDVFWRTATSGGRATVHKRKGELQRQAGDICAVAPEGHGFTDRFYIEAKAYKNLALTSFLLDGKGVTAEFWRRTCAEAESYEKAPLLILKQNRFPALIVARPEESLPCWGAFTLEALRRGVHGFVVYLLDELLAADYTGPGRIENRRYVDVDARARRRRSRCRLIKTTSKPTQSA